MPDLRNIPQPTQWKELQQHPRCAEYPDLHGPKWDRMVAGVRKFGIVGGRRIVIFEGKVLDGWQLQRACVECDVKPTYATLPDGMTIDEYIEIMNDDRRHESEEMVEARVLARRERVCGMKSQGMSNREIAEKEGVSRETVRKDLQAAKEEQSKNEHSGGNGLPPENKHEDVNASSPAPEPEKIHGRDGKDYSNPKVRLLCSRCQRVGVVPDCPNCKLIREGQKPVKAGGIIGYSVKDFDDAFGCLLREIDNCGNTYNAKDSTTAYLLREQLGEFRVKFHEWHKELTK